MNPRPLRPLPERGSLSFMPESPAGAGSVRLPASALGEVELQARLELGRALLPVRNLLALGPGAVVELDRRVGDPVNLYVNERLVARGEIVVAGGSFALRVTEVLPPDPA